MAGKPDLNKLKSEIESRKKERNMTSSNLGESVGRGVAPRDVFLNGLLESLTTGKQTPAINLVKTLDNQVAAKKGESPKMRVNEVVQSQPQSRQPIPMPTREAVDMSPERDEQLFHDMEMKRKQTLAESMQGYINAPVVGASSYNQQTVPMGGAMLNEQYLAETVKKVVNNYLVENLGVIFEEAIKDTMLEMYSVDRIKNVLTENKDILRSAVIEVIKEIQAKSKSRAQQ